MPGEASFHMKCQVNQQIFTYLLRGWQRQCAALSSSQPGAMFFLLGTLDNV